MSTLTQAQRSLLTEAHDNLQAEHHGGGVSARDISGDSRTVANQLVVMGLAQWHPPRAPTILIPTPLGQERVVALRKRQAAAKKAARKHRASSGQVQR